MVRDTQLVQSGADLAIVRLLVGRSPRVGVDESGQ